MAPWVDGGPCPNCETTRAAIWYPTVGTPQYCHSRPCRRAGGWLPAKKRGRGHAAEEEEEEASADEKCYDIKRILYIGFGNPLQKRSKKERRKEPADDDVWFDVLGTFGDPDDEDDPGGPDRRWVQMEDLGHCSKQHVKAAIAAA